MVFVYALKLELDKYYIGKTNTPSHRVEDHISEYGSAWTKKYKPNKLIELVPDCDSFDEDKYVLKYMQKYGIDNVRGGSFCQVTLSFDNLQILKRMINGSSDKCFNCSEPGHFIESCPESKTIKLTNQRTDEYDGIWQCSYCDEVFETEQKAEYHEENNCVAKSKDKIEYGIQSLCNDMLENCKKYDETKCGMIKITDLIKALIETDEDTFGNITMSNIFGMCQSINILRHDIRDVYADEIVLNYIDTSNRVTMNYYDFCAGSYCVYTEKKCIRCNRYCHDHSECVGDYDTDNNEIFFCEKCTRRFDTGKGLTTHKRYCNKKKRKMKKSRRMITNANIVIEHSILKRERCFMRIGIV
jgi:hypothetical protein